MRKLVGALCAALLLAVPSAQAGTSQNPDLSDPAGDQLLAFLTPSPYATPWADLRAVWLESIKDESGTVTGVAVTMRMSQARAGDYQGIDGVLRWTHSANPGCEFEYRFDRLPNRMSVWTSPDDFQSLTVGCPYAEGQEPDIYAGNTVVTELDWRKVPSTLNIDQADYRVEFPLSGFASTTLKNGVSDGTSFTGMRFEIEGYDGPVFFVIDLARLDSWTIGS